MTTSPLDYLKFLIEQEQREVSNNWTRFNLLLALNTAVLGAILVNLGETPAIPNDLLITISIGGILFCVIWFQVHRMSIYYADRWLADAIRLVRKHPKLSKVFDKSMINRDRPRGPSATQMVYLVIVEFAVGWGFILFRTLAGQR